MCLHICLQVRVAADTTAGSDAYLVLLDENVDGVKVTQDWLVLAQVRLGFVEPLEQRRQRVTDAT